MKKLILLVLTFSLFSCTNGSMGDSASADYSMNMKASPEAYESEEAGYGDGSSNNGYSSQPGQSTAPIERKIIRTANLRMQVDDVEKTSAKIEALIKQKGGFISDVNMSASGSYITNNITIRIPNEKLDSLLDSFSGEAIHIDYKRINSKDVTEEFVDIELRLKTKKEVRDRYIDVLRNKAKTVEEILNAEERIRVIQEEIESKEGRLRYLSNQVALSTINLEVYQHDGTGIVRKSYSSKIARAFSDGWDGIKEFVLVLVNLWPVLIILGLVIYYFRKWVRIKKK